MRAVAAMAVLLMACGSDRAEEAPQKTCPTPLVVRAERCIPSVPTCAESELPTTTGACVPIGVDRCDEGFEADGRGGCRAVIGEDCSPFELAVPGDRTCHPVDDCAGTPTDSDAIHVDGAAAAGGDGAKERPFQTIAAALEAAKSRDGSPMIAIAKGSYVEQLVASHAVRLVGACASTTEIVAPEGPGSFAFASAFPFELRHLGIRRGAAGGIFLVGEEVPGVPTESSALVDHVWVRSTTGIAIGAESAKRRVTLTIRDSLIEDITDTGVAFQGAHGVVERTVIRRITSPAATDAYGAYLAGASATLTIRRSVIERSAHGVGVLGGDARIEGSLLRDFRASKVSSVGISADGAKTKLSVTGSVLERTQLAAILVSRASATIERNTIRSVFPGSELAVGEGVHLDQGGQLSMRASLVEGSVAHGVFVGDGDATLERVIVRDTQPRTIEQDFGAGIAAQPDKTTSHLTLREVIVRTSFIAGVQINGASLDLESAFITDVRAQKVDGLFGDALALQSSKRRSNGELLLGTANVSGLVVRNSKRAGVGVFGATLQLSSSVLECSAIDLAITDRFDSSGIASNPPAVRDGGGNVCGCEAFGPCVARTEGLAPSPHLRD